MQNLKLKDLIAGARQAEPGAFAEIVRRFQPALLQYAFRKVSDGHLAEDIVQEAFLDAHRKLDQLRHDEAFSSWIRTIVHKHCDRFLRRPREMSRAPDLLANVEDTREPGIDFTQIFETVPEDDRRVAEAFLLEGKSQAEIADEFGIPLHAVRRRIHRARRILRESRDLYLVGRGTSRARAA